MAFSGREAAISALGELIKDELVDSGRKRFRSAVDSVRDYVTRPAAPSGRSFNYSYGRFYRPRFRKRRSVRKRRFRRSRRSKRFRRSKTSVGRATNRKRGTMRSFNKGRLSLQTKLMNGASLPYQTSVKMNFRATGTMSFMNTPSQNAFRSFMLNSTNLCSPEFAATVPFKSGWRYLDMWKSLYSNYLITGARMNISIAKAGFQHNLQPLSSIGDYPGYWYARVYYRRGTTLTGNTVGHPIGYTVATGGTEALWTNRREFLSDPTVSYVMDGRPKVVKTGYVGPSSSDLGMTEMIPSASTYVEFETKTNVVKLKVLFSARKHFQNKNYIDEQQVNPWANSPNSVFHFFARIGYVAFDDGGYISKHIPMDRDPLRTVTIDHSVRMILRNPIVGPDGEVPSGARRDFTEYEQELEKQYMQQKLVEEEVLNNPHSLMTLDCPTTEWDSVGSVADSEGCSEDSELDSPDTVFSSDSFVLSRRGSLLPEQEETIL